MQIAVGQLNAAQVEIAGAADGHRPQHGVENAQLGVPDRFADRHAGTVHRRQCLAGRRLIGNIDRRLRRAIQVVQRRGDQRLIAGSQFTRQRFAAAEHAFQAGGGAPWRPLVQGLHPDSQHGRNEMQRGHAIVVDQGRQRLRIAVRLRRRHHQARADHQRPEELPDGNVEAARRFLQDHVLRIERILVLHPEQAVDDRPVVHHHAFRPPGRA